MRLAVDQPDPDVDHRVAGHALVELRARRPSRLRDELARHRPADDLVDELEAAPRSSGSISMWQTAYCPCPPDCLTWRPCPWHWPDERLAERVLTGSTSTSTPSGRAAG